MQAIRRHIYILIASIIALTAGGCSDDNDDIIWDFSPVTIDLDVTDADGNSLLRAETPGNILASGLTATFSDKEYTLRMPDDNMQSRALPARFIGLYLDENIWMDQDMMMHSSPRLCFGEFQGFEDFDHTVVFHFPSADRNVTVRVVSKARWKGNDPDWRLDYYLDGVHLDSEQVRGGIKITL